jgi:hypothetical protein
MTRLPLNRPSVLAVPALLLLAACGSSATTSSSAASSPTATPAPSATANANPALEAALTAGEVSSSGGFTQKSDGLLGSTPNTDSRVFTNADSSLVVEVDIAVDTGASAASSDYPAYQSAAAAQVANAASTPSASLGQSANEYIGTNSSGKIAASLSFVEGRYIAVVTVIATGSADSAAAQSTAESVAQAEDTKINSVGS